MTDNTYIPTMPQTSADGHIPTVAQTSVGGHIPTVAQTSADGHIPTVAQTSAGEYIPTVAQAGTEEYAATVPQAGANADGNTSARLIHTKIGFTDDKGRDFIIDGGAPVSTNTGEAQIYRCSLSDGTGDYVAKVLVTLRPDSSPKKLRTRKKVIEFLDKYSANPSSHILPLLGHGVVSVNGGEYFVDVYPYCEDGDIGRRAGEFTLGKLVSDVIPAVNEAVHLFHQERLVHRDLKPDNLFYYKGSIVIGDFGITCELNTDDYAVDTEKIGTLGYFAPELMSEAAIAASDYYAFGQTIWSLYHGEMMYRETIRSHGGFFSSDARNTVSDLMRKNEFPGLDEIDKKDAFFEVLIRGLLQYDPNVRFGYDDVQKWLVGDKSLYMRVKTSQGDDIFDRVLSINGKDCVNNSQVAAGLSADWGKSINLLYKDSLYNQYKYTLCRDKEAAMIKRIYDSVTSSKSNPNDRGIYQEIGLSRVIMNLSGGRLLNWRGRTYIAPAQICADLAKTNNLGNSKNDFYILILSGLVEEWLRQAGITNKSVLDELSRLQKMAQSSRMGVTVAYFWMYYMFSPDRKNVTYGNCRNIDDIARMLLASASALYRVEGELCCVENPYLLGFLCAQGYDASVSLFLTDSAIDYKRHYDMLFDLFENNVIGEDVKKLVHNAYCEFGPQAHIVWWKRNLSDYKFVGVSAKQIEQNANAISVNPNAQLASQRAAIYKLQQNYDDFKKLFKVNFFVGLSGIRRLAGKDYIYSGKFSSMLVYHFLNQDAPLGFKYSIKL